MSPGGRYAPPGRVRWRVCVTALAGCGLVAGLASACSDTVPPAQETVPSPSPTTPATQVTLPPNPLLLLQPASAHSSVPQQSGSVPVSLDVSTVTGGQVTVTRAVDGSPAFSFPAFRAAGAYPRAVVVARNKGAQDELDPGTRDFVYGADIRLDALSAGRSEDNGNNVIQRGLSSDPVLFKLETDADRRPGCVVKGRSGEVSVYSRQPIQSGLWYRVQCERTHDGVFVSVGEYLPSGDLLTVGRESAGATGSVTPSSARVPVSVGGKVSHDGAVVASATDQFNGDIANAYLALK